MVCFSSSNRGSLPLVQIFMGTVCGLLFTATKNAELMIAITLEKCFAVLEFTVLNGVIMLFVSVVLCLERDRNHYF